MKSRRRRGDPQSFLWESHVFFQAVTKKICQRPQNFLGAWCADVVYELAQIASANSGGRVTRRRTNFDARSRTSRVVVVVSVQWSIWEVAASSREGAELDDARSFEVHMFVQWTKHPRCCIARNVNK